MNNTSGKLGYPGVSPELAKKDHGHPVPRVWPLSAGSNPNSFNRIPNGCNGFAYDATDRVLWGYTSGDLWIKIVGHDISFMGQPVEGANFTGQSTVK